MEQVHEPSDEHQVTPLELFFDLAFVFAMTQVTILLADDPTWGGVLRGMLVSRRCGGRGVSRVLTSALDLDEGGMRLTNLAATAAMLSSRWRSRAPSSSLRWPPLPLSPPSAR